MPNPKTKTVTFELKDAITELKRGRTEFRSDKSNIVHCAIGKVSMEAPALAANVSSVVTEVEKRRPPDAKGNFVRSVAVASSMGPGVKIEVREGQ
jgi:large subunit ribosomal protein L1